MVTMTVGDRHALWQRDRGTARQMLPTVNPGSLEAEPRQLGRRCARKVQALGCLPSVTPTTSLPRPSFSPPLYL